MENKNYALITGASSGLGIEFAKLLAKRKYPLILVARSVAPMEALASQLKKEEGIEVQVIACDLSRSENVKSLHQSISAKNWKVEILINNAGFGDFGTFHSANGDKLSQMMELNMISVTLLCRYFLPEMVARKAGRILNLASTAAFQPGPGMAVYYASKAYVLSLSEALSSELKGTGVTVTALCPGPTATGFAKAASLEKSNLFERVKPMGASEVAQKGIQAMFAGKAIEVTGLMNKIMVQSVRFTPRAVMREIVKSMQAQRAT